MSMISSLIDKLNKSADEWNGSNMFELARMCREAADTIWELRDDLLRANAENAKLRELVEDMWEGYNDPRCEECHLKDTTTCADCPICAREAAVIDRMRELGVEV